MIKNIILQLIFKRGGIRMKKLAVLILSVFMVLVAGCGQKDVKLPEINIPLSICTCPQGYTYVGIYQPIWNKVEPEKVITWIKFEYVVPKEELQRHNGSFAYIFSHPTTNIISRDEGNKLCESLFELSDKVLRQTKFNEHTLREIKQLMVIKYYIPNTIIIITYNDGCQLVAHIDRDNKYKELKIISNENEDHKWKISQELLDKVNKE